MTQENAIVGEWFGRGAARLNLAENVTELAFVALSDGNGGSYIDLSDFSGVSLIELSGVQSGNGEVVITAVPEPSTYASIFGLFALGAAGVREMRRRRKLAA